ncbi:MAG: ribosome maturation factor RimP [Acidimicrobiales bacterium]
MGRREAIRVLAEPLVAAEGAELWDVEVGGGVIRVLADRPDGIDIDALARASHAISAALDGDAELAGPGRYVLELSSPGLERTLRSQEHFSRFVGGQVAVKLAVPLSGQRRLKGTLLEVSGSSVRLGYRDGGGEWVEATVGYDQIDRARTVAAWGSPDPGGPPGSAPGATTAPPAGVPTRRAGAVPEDAR